MKEKSQSKEADQHFARSCHFNSALSCMLPGSSLAQAMNQCWLRWPPPFTTLPGAMGCGCQQQALCTGWGFERAEFHWLQKQTKRPHV